MKRPTSLTIIGWFLIVIAGFTLVSQLTQQDNPALRQVLAESPLPAWFHLAFAILGCVAYAASGYGILKGLNWSRFLYVGWSVLATLFGFLTTPFTAILLFSLIFVLVIAFFLFRPAANEWFAGRTAAATE